MPSAKADEGEVGDARNQAEESVRAGGSTCQPQAPMASATKLAAALCEGEKVKARQKLTRHLLLKDKTTSTYRPRRTVLTHHIFIQGR
jgi:hypothetical protein